LGELGEDPGFGAVADAAAVLAGGSAGAFGGAEAFGASAGASFSPGRID
jgi:hypothetical protein